MCKLNNSVIVPLCVPRKSSGRRSAKVDACIAPLVALLNLHGFKTVGCCCGHGTYKPTILYEHKGKIHEYFSGKVILRKRRFYRSDETGYYYVPEVI